MLKTCCKTPSGSDSVPEGGCYALQAVQLELRASKPKLGAREQGIRTRALSWSPSQRILPQAQKNVQSCAILTDVASARPAFLPSRVRKMTTSSRPTFPAAVQLQLMRLRGANRNAHVRGWTQRYNSSSVFTDNPLNCSSGSTTNKEKMSICHPITLLTLQSIRVYSKFI